MLQYKITLKNFYILAVTITILRNLNNNKILVNSYQLNSHHHPHITDDLSRATSSSSSSRLATTSTLFHENKLNHHLNLDNTNYNAQKNLQQNNDNKFSQQQSHNSYELSNRRHNLGLNKKYLHHIPSISTSLSTLSSEKSVQQNNNFENKEFYNEFRHNEYPKEIYNPLIQSTSLKSLSSSSTIQNDNLQHHRILDEATHPFSYSLPTHIAISNQKISTLTNNFHHMHQNKNENENGNENGNLEKNPQTYHSHEHQLNSATINLRKKSYPTPTTKIPLKLHHELNQHKILDQHQNQHQHHNLHHSQYHRHNVNPTVNIETIKDLNEKQDKLHSITLLTLKSHNKTMTPSATNVKGAPLPLTLHRKNSLQQQQHHEKKQHQHQHQHKHSTTMNVNEFKSKSHHTDKKETTHSIESSIGRHHHYNNQHNINQYNQDIVNKNVDNINKNHKINSDHNDHDSYDNHNNNKINNSDDNDRDDDDDENDDEEDDEDYYYDNEDRKNDNHNDYDNDNDGNHFQFEAKGDGGDGGGNSGKEQQKNHHNPHKRITLNRDYHEHNRYINKNKNIDNNEDDDDDDSDSNIENTEEQYDDNSDDLDLLKKDLINREVFRNFERDFDLYDYIDDEPHDDDNTTNTEKSSNLTQEKWEKLGTAEAVANSRRRYYSQVQRVNAHIMRVGYEAECRIPKPKIIQISEPSKRYVPHCTVLHRCSDDTGCCQSDFRTCVMKKSQTVDLYFYVVPLGMKEPIVETLSFENHTECHCIERERYRPQNNRNDTINSIQNEQQITTTTTNLTDNVNSCQCAKYFTVFEENIRYKDSDSHNTNNIKKKCRCDCVSNDDVCQSFKQGIEGFDVEDRRCISENRCLIPTCEFGEFSNGRCPKNEQKRYIRAWHFD